MKVDAYEDLLDYKSLYCKEDIVDKNVLSQISSKEVLIKKDRPTWNKKNKKLNHNSNTWTPSLEQVNEAALMRKNQSENITTKLADISGVGLSLLQQLSDQNCTFIKMIPDIKPPLDLCSPDRLIYFYSMLCNLDLVSLSFFYITV